MEEKRKTFEHLIEIYLGIHGDISDEMFLILYFTVFDNETNKYSYDELLEEIFLRR